MNNSVLQQFGNLDIYIFDQLLKGNILPGQRILDAGCGTGRNHYYFVKEGFDVSAFDINADALNVAKETANALKYNTEAKFLLGDMSHIPFENESFDWIFNVAVLHFAHNKVHFEQMLSELWRVCAKGGKILIRLATDIGIAHLMQPLGNQRFIMPDGSERFVLNHNDLLFYTEELKATLFEPLKTTNVQNLRCMTTWCLQKD